MDAREGRLWVLSHEPYRPWLLSKLLLFLVRYVINIYNAPQFVNYMKASRLHAKLCLIFKILFFFFFFFLIGDYHKK